MSDENRHEAPDGPLLLVDDTDLAAPELAVLVVAAALLLGLGLVVNPLIGLLAVGVAALAGLTAHILARDPLVTAASVAFAPLYVTGIEVGLLALLGAAALAAVVLSRIPLMVFFAVAALAWPSGAGVPLAAVAVAAVVGGSVYHREMPRWAGRAVALPVFFVGGILHQAWIVLLLALLVGLLVDYTLRHPALPRLARSTEHVAPWAAAIPASVLFVLAAIGKSPSVGPVRQLVVAWGALGVGILIAAAVLGAAWLIRASDRAAPVWLAILPATLVVLPTAAFLGEMQLAARGAAALWPLLVLPTALGVRKIAGRAGRFRTFAVPVMALAAVTAAGLRFWLD